VAHTSATVALRAMTVTDDASLADGSPVAGLMVWRVSLPPGPDLLVGLGCAAEAHYIRGNVWEIRTWQRT